MKVFKSKEFIEKLKWLVNDVPNYYYSANGTYCNYNWNNGKFMMDCVVSIKGLLWGFKADKNAPHGGAVYGANGVRDFTANGGINYCDEPSGDFSKLTPGEYLCMAGTEWEHAGVYLGDGKVFECTTGWGVNRCIISEIDSNGGRYYNGRRNLRWTKHGKLIYIDYTDEPTPTPSDKKVNVYYKVRTQRHGWLPEVKNLEDYAGWEGSPIVAVAIRVDKGSVWYQAHEKGKGWLPKVTGYDINDFYNGYAGNNTPIDCIRVYYNTPDSIRPYKKAKYKVNNYEWQYDDETTNGQDGYAGEYGIDATEFRIEIK
jgi:hypothetical protein